MLKRISVLLVWALVMVALAANVALARAGDEGKLSDKGQPGSDEVKEQGSPDDPNAWGSVASQLGDEGVMGEHSSDPVPRVPGNETPRDGLGNVSRNDAGNEGTDPAADTGDTVADHACIAAANPLPGFPDVQPDCTAEPGRSS